jgi:L,D-transpeptidase YcbB
MKFAVPFIVLSAVAAVVPAAAEAPQAASLHGPATARHEPASAGLAIPALLADPAATVGERPLHHADQVRRFYAERQGAAAWTRDAGSLAKATVLADILASADREGLIPADYHLAAITARLGSADPDRLAELDVLLTDAAMAYAVHLRSGRVPPRSVSADLAVDPPQVDPLQVARGAVAAADTGAFLAGFAPPHAGYAGLRLGLEELRAFAAQGGGWPEAGPGPVLKPGMEDPSVPALRRRLAATGEYALPELDGTVYDAPLEAAVKRFQERMGLGTDGVVGAQTRRALNMTLDDRIRQVVANMERLRWLPDHLGDRHVSVNIPGFWLAAVDHGETKLSMPVIVGSTVRQTPVFSNRISYLVLNPTWTIPETIARKDVLPKVQKDPGWLIEQGIQVFDGWSQDAQVLNPYDVDWHAVGERITRYRLRQDPGPLNSLGRVKFMFPNEFDIYLHDTPQRSKFGRAVRTMSSGCVRVGDPDALAAFLTEGMKGWSEEKHREILDSGMTKTLWLPRPVPVHLLYQTVWREADGRMVFRPDIYERDPELLAAIERHSTAGVRMASADNS